MRYLVVAFLLFALSAPALAQQPADPPAAGEPAPTRIEVDEKANVIRFIVEGQERAVLDSEGLRVNGRIEYTDVIVDIDTWPQEKTGEAADAP